MKTAQSECHGPDRRRLSAVLSDERARQLLSRLQSGPATPGDLAVSLATAERDCPPAAVPPGPRRHYRQRLYHDYLPRLDAADLIDHSPDGQVRLTSVPTDRFEVRLPDFDEPEDPAWPAAATVLARAYRYRLLSTLVDADGPVPLAVLATTVLEAEPDAAESSHDLSVALHHVDLPTLEAAGLVAYDLDQQTVTATPAARSLL